MANDRTNNPGEYYKDDPEVGLLMDAYEIIQNCLELACSIVQLICPNAERPEVFIYDDNEPNATSLDNVIEINKGLFTTVSHIIDKHYSDERLHKHGLLVHIPGKVVRNGIRAYAWRFTLMHELYHIWHCHDIWDSMYYFDGKGLLIQRYANAPGTIHPRRERAYVVNIAATPEDRERNITSQAMELDADSCAVSMLVNFMRVDYDGRCSLGQKIDKINYLSDETTLLIGALYELFRVFDGDRGAQFDKLSDDEIFYDTHPIPAIRMTYAEEIMDAMLWKHVKDRNNVATIERNWHVVDIDMASDNGTTDNWRNDYASLAYTDKAEKHRCILKQRMTDMYDSMSLLATGNMPEKLAAEDIVYSSFAVAFTDQGESLRGWK